MLPGDYRHEVLRGQRKRRVKWIVFEVLVAILLIVPAIIFYSCWRYIIIGRILQKIELKPGSSAYATWLNPPITSTRSYYLFNITNPVEVVLNPSPDSTTLRLTETRPYSYNLVTDKENIKWSSDRTIVSYSVRRSFTRHPDLFDPSSVNDTGTFVDMLRATFRTQYQAKADQTFFTIAGNDVFYNRNAVEQLEGFTSDLFLTLRDKMTGPNTAKSGFIYRYNGSRSFNYTIKAGSKEKGQVLAFANEMVPFNITSPSQYAFPIYDGLTFVPMLFDKPSVNIFQADACRPIRIQYNQSIMFEEINVHQYLIKLIDFNSCTDANNQNSCPEVDKLDVSKCVSSSLPDGTVYLSKPHFYGSNNQSLEEMNIEGFEPSQEKHESFIYFEPYTGTPLKARHRIQMNIDAQIDPMRVSSEDETRLEWAKRKGVRRMLPLMWFDQDVTLSNDTIKQLRSGVRILKHRPWYIVPLAIGLAIGLIVVMELLFKRAANKERHRRGGYVKSEALFEGSNR